MNYSVIDISNIKEFEKNRTSGPMVIWYYADWCGHCTDFEPEWEKYKHLCNKKLNINTAKVNNDIIDKLSYNPEISSFPTIEFHNNGKRYSEFIDRKRTSDELINFTKENLKTLGIKNNKKSLKSKHNIKKRSHSLKKKSNTKKQKKKSTKKRRKTI